MTGIVQKPDIFMVEDPALVIWPQVTGAQSEPSRLLAALALLVVGNWLNDVFAAGMLTLYGVQFISG
jgi:hypothetical protein